MTPKIRPITVRRLLPPDQRLRSSLSAAIGGIFEARRAGEMAASRVTPTPTMAAANQVRAAITKGPSGRPEPSPAWAMSALILQAIPIPAKTPVRDATIPISRASTRTEERICRPVAPTALRRPSSLMRCPRTIANVLLMMNALTIRATAAKTKSAF